MRTSNRIAAETRVQGAVETHDDLVVEGHLIGSLAGTGDVMIAQEGIVEADVHVRKLIVHGVVVGSIAATESVEVGPRAQIKGDIRTQQLTLEAGGRIAGQVKTGVSVEAPRSNRGSRFARRDPVAVQAPRSAPVEAKPAAVETKVEPVAAKPEPVEAKPEPVEAKPEPVEAKADKVEAKPEPVEAKAETKPSPKPEVVETDDDPAANSLGYGGATGKAETSDKQKPQKA